MKQIKFVSLRCAEHHRKYSECKEDISQSVKSAEQSLSQLISQKVTCLADCTDQQQKLRVRITLLLYKVDSHFSPLLIQFVMTLLALWYRLCVRRWSPCRGVWTS